MNVTSLFLSAKDKVKEKAINALLNSSIAHEISNRYIGSYAEVIQVFYTTGDSIEIVARILGMQENITLYIHNIELAHDGSSITITKASSPIKGINALLERLVVHKTFSVPEKYREWIVKAQQMLL